MFPIKIFQYQVDIDSADEARQYIQEHGLDKFKVDMKKSQQNIISKYMLTIIFCFPIYLALCKLIYIGDPVHNNQVIYNFLRALHIPVLGPDGWNLSYILAGLFAIVIFSYFYKNYPYRWLKKDFKYRQIRWAINLWFIALLALIGYYITPVPIERSNCTRYDICFLFFGDFFLGCSFLTYIGATYASLTFFSGLKPIVGKHFAGEK